MIISDTLLSLLRLSLGNQAEPVDLSNLKKEDWQGLIDLSFDQGVAAIAVDGLQKAIELNPEQELGIDGEELESLKYEWFGEVFQSEDDYRKYVEAISSLVKTYSDNGIETMILKGYGLSLNYPIPAHRPVGDIDVYLFGKWHEADILMEDRNIRIDYSHHHHSVFYWMGQMVENHYDIINRYSGISGRREDDMLKKMASEEHRETIIDGSRIYLPSATFNGIFLIRHAAAHFAGDKITLRHLLDWALFVDKEWREIDWPFVADWLSRLGLLRFFCCMNALSIDCLGIPAEKFPWLERDCVLESRVLADILHPAFCENGSGFWFKLKRLKANMWKRNLVASESLVPRMIRLALSHIIKPDPRSCH